MRCWLSPISDGTKKAWPRRQSTPSAFHLHLSIPQPQTPLTFPHPPSYTRPPPTSSFPQTVPDCGHVHTHPPPALQAHLHRPPPLPRRLQRGRFLRRRRHLSRRQILAGVLRNPRRGSILTRGGRGAEHRHGGHAGNGRGDESRDPVCGAGGDAPRSRGAKEVLSHSNIALHV